MEGVDSVDAEAAGPATQIVLHEAHAQQLVEVDARPVERQLTARQCRQEVVALRALQEGRQRKVSCAALTFSNKNGNQRDTTTKEQGSYSAVNV